MRACGLKLGAVHRARDRGDVAPHAGVWIEPSAPLRVDSALRLRPTRTTRSPVLHLTIKRRVCRGVLRFFFCLPPPGREVQRAQPPPISPLDARVFRSRYEHEMILPVLRGGY